MYVKPPVDFKPVVYPNRRLDGIRATDQLANQVTLLTPLAPYPFTFPRGVSSWSFGGPAAVNRGSYWESLGTDEALNLATGNSKQKISKNKKKSLLTSASKLNSAFVPLVIYPGTNNPGNTGASVYQLPASYQIQYHSPSYSLWPESTVHFSSATNSHSKKISTAPNRLSNSGSRRVNSPANNLKPLTSQTVKSPNYSSSSSSSSSSSLDAQRTKLPVGLTSWFLGGVRDLNGKHWKLPELTVNGVDVVPLNNASGDAASSSTTPDLMMTSDGEYEKVEPSVVDSTSLTETEKEAQPSVTFDDDSDFVNTLS